MNKSRHHECGEPGGPCRPCREQELAPTVEVIARLCSCRMASKRVCRHLPSSQLCSAEPPWLRSSEVPAPQPSCLLFTDHWFLKGSQSAAIRALPVHSATREPPQVLLHAGVANLKSAGTSPAERLIPTAATALVGPLPGAPSFPAFPLLLAHVRVALRQLSQSGFCPQPNVSRKPARGSAHATSTKKFRSNATNLSSVSELPGC
jgi:hypothetical protein